MRPVKTHKFFGRVYNIITEQLDGWCDVPSKKENYNIFLQDFHKNTRGSLETLLHESIHACKPHMPEEDVERMAKEITDLVWRLGYRRDRNE